jgi:L-asparaginase
MAMPTRVLLLATKDTMAYAERSAVASGPELLRSIPPDRLAADVVVEDVLAEPSWDMSPATMLTLARRARSAILEEGFSGVVITHGTDTVEETAFLADLIGGLALRRGAIVFTGAMRFLDELSSDGPGNLASSIVVAADPAVRGQGAVVCFNDEVHAARWVTKVDAVSIAAFSSAPQSILARVSRGQLRWVAAAPRRPPDPVGEPESDIALIKTYPGMEPVLLSAVVDAGARGVVLEGTGTGNVPVNLFAAISELTQWDIPVVIASRCRTGDSDLSEFTVPYGLAAQVGAIGARGLPPAKARLALMVALGTGGGVKAAREWFAAYPGVPS